ncbi:MAG: flagellar motor protein PomA, partial [Oceanospirillum sp.]|nr:flagellar motor protein PomA [Oceanospirillum sp.]
MDIATLLGIIGAIGIVAMAMVLGGDPLIFINPPSLLIVIGGSMFVVLSKFSLGQFLG